MSTTGLVVELLVVGSGVSVWLTLLVLTVFDYTWLPASFELDPIVALVALPFLYVLGLIVDRAADGLLSPRVDALRRAEFPTKEAFQDARAESAGMPAIWGLFEYGRSRMRVARGWLLNAALIAISGNLFVWIQLPTHAPRIEIALFGTVAAALCAVGSYLAWKDLNEAEVAALKRQFPHPG